jgi:N-acetylmuramoyl-L-alanine amidase
MKLSGRELRRNKTLRALLIQMTGAAHSMPAVGCGGVNYLTACPRMVAGSDGRMSSRGAGWWFSLCALALALAGAATARAEPLQLAALTPRGGDGGGVPLSSELDCLASNVYWEARAEPRLGQIAVAAVTLNRVADPAFPDSVCGVVRQGEARGRDQCQFSWYCDGLDDWPRNPSAWLSARQIARLALAGKLPDPTSGALWFHADSVHPDWPELTPIMKIGSHVFYRRWPTIGQLLPIARAATQPPVPAPKPSAIGRGILLDASLAGPGRDRIPIGGAAPAGRAPYDGQLTIAAVQPRLMTMLAAASQPDFLTLVDELRSSIDPGANLDLPVVSLQSEIVATGRSPTRTTLPLRPAPTMAREAGPPAIVPTEGLPPGLDRYARAPMSTGVAVLLEEAIGVMPAPARVPMPRLFGPQARAG